MAQSLISIPKTSRRCHLQVLERILGEQVCRALTKKEAIAKLDIWDKSEILPDQDPQKNDGVNVDAASDQADAEESEKEGKAGIAKEINESDSGSGDPSSAGNMSLTNSSKTAAKTKQAEPADGVSPVVIIVLVVLLLAVVAVVGSIAAGGAKSGSSIPPEASTVTEDGNAADVGSDEATQPVPEAHEERPDEEDVPMMLLPSDASENEVADTRAESSAPQPAS